MIKPTAESNLKRFWAKVDKTETCWLWTASTQGAGYGQFQVNRRVVSAHRYSWMLANGEPPKGVDLDHTCRNRICVNPSHLRIASRKQNMENRSGPQSGNSSGSLGVSWDRGRNKWKAQMAHDGVKYFLGRFDSIEEAAKVAREARLAHYTHNELDRTALPKG